jgi:hypothetical protein
MLMLSLAPIVSGGKRAVQRCGSLKVGYRQFD